MNSILGSEKELKGEERAIRELSTTSYCVGSDRLKSAHASRGEIPPAELTDVPLKLSSCWTFLYLLKLR